MSGLTEMMEYITKYYLATRKLVKGFDVKALHMLLKYNGNHEQGRKLKA
jgi:hypothetical protein